MADRLLNFGLDPAFSSYRKIFITQILNKVKVIELEGFAFVFLFCDRPIVKVDIVGTVISIKKKEKKVVICVDDGTAVIRCIKYCELGSEQPFFGLHVGNLVSVKGILNKIEIDNTYEFAINVKFLNILTDPNVELLHWATVMHYYELDYSKQHNNTNMITKSATIQKSTLIHCVCEKQNAVRAVIKSVFGYCNCNRTTPCRDEREEDIRYHVLHSVLLMEAAAFSSNNGAVFHFSIEDLMRDATLLSVIAQYRADRRRAVAEETAGIAPQPCGGSDMAGKRQRLLPPGGPAIGSGDAEDGRLVAAACASLLREKLLIRSGSFLRLAPRPQHVPQPV